MPRTPQTWPKRFSRARCASTAAKASAVPKSIYSPLPAMGFISTRCGARLSLSQWILRKCSPSSKPRRVTTLRIRSLSPSGSTSSNGSSDTCLHAWRLPSFYTES